MIAERIPALNELSKDEKILLAYELLGQNDESTTESEAAMVDLIGALLEKHHANPDEGISYDDMKKKYRPGGK